jgi:hypothetical protein
VLSDTRFIRRRCLLLAFGAFLLVLVASACWILYCCALPSLQAERTLHTTLLTVRLVERFVSERGRWPHSWSELEGVTTTEELFGEKWPGISPEVQRRVSIDFEIDPLAVARQTPMSFTAIRPIGPHYEFRHDDSVILLQEALLKSMKATHGP